MAIAGSATTAYNLGRSGDKVRVNRTTAMKELCTDPAHVAAALCNGQQITVQGSDMWEVQGIIQAQGWEIAP